MTSPSFLEQFVAACEDILRSLNLARTQESIVRNAAQLFGAKGASLMLYHPDGDRLEVSASWGLSQAYLNKGPVSAQRSLGEIVGRRPVVVADVEVDPYVQYRQAAREEGIASIVGLPVAAGNLLVGSLRLYFPEPRPITADQMRAMEGLARLSGLALKKDYYLSTLQDYTNRIHEQSTAASLKATVQGLLKSAVTSVHAKGGALFLWKRRKGTLELLGSHGLSERYLSKGPVSAEASLGEVVEGRPVVLSSLKGDKRLQYPEDAERENIRAIVGLPVILGSQVAGALRFYFPFDFAPDEDELAWMEHLAHQVGLAVERGQLIHQLQADYFRYLDLLEDLEKAHAK